MAAGPGRGVSGSQISKKVPAPAPAIPSCGEKSHQPGLGPSFATYGPVTWDKQDSHLLHQVRTLALGWLALRGQMTEGRRSPQHGVCYGAKAHRPFALWASAACAACQSLSPPGPARHHPGARQHLPVQGQQTPGHSPPASASPPCHIPGGLPLPPPPPHRPTLSSLSQMPGQGEGTPQGEGGWVWQERGRERCVIPSLIHSLTHPSSSPGSRAGLVGPFASMGRSSLFGPCLLGAYI